jgi:hypothetical protein
VPKANVKQSTVESVRWGPVWVALVVGDRLLAYTRRDCP